jgi:hypothetical protein
VGLLAAHAVVPPALAQVESEVITEPPPDAFQPGEPPPVELPPDELPADELPPDAVLADELPPDDVSLEPLPSEAAKPKEPIGHLRVGGGLGFGFATGFVSVGVAPQVSYIIKRIVEPGVSFRYEFARDRVAVPEVTWNTFGGSLFVRLFPIQPLFFLVEGEVINTGAKQAGFSSGRETYGNLLLGGGFLLGVGKGAFMGMSLKVAVLRNPFYPDAFPIISAGGGYAF